MKQKLQGSAALLIGTIIWGSAFIAQSVGMDYIGPMTFQAIRCFLGAFFLIPVIYLFDKAKPGRTKFLDPWRSKKLWLTGLVCGFALFIAAGLQQVGLVYTTAGKAGFITAMYIIIVPFFGLFFGKKPQITAWISVGLAAGGLYLLSCVGVTDINIGDILMLGSALGFAVQITLIDRFADDLDGLRLNCIQSFFCAIFSAVLMFATESIDLQNVLSCWLPLGYAGILSMGVAYSLQIIGQKRIDPTPASLIMSLESVFSALCAWLILNEKLTLWESIGSVLVFSAVILSQIPVKKKTHD